MKLQRFLWGLALCIVSPSLLLGQITVGQPDNPLLVQVEVSAPGVTAWTVDPPAFLPPIVSGDKVLLILLPGPYKVEAQTAAGEGFYRRFVATADGKPPKPPGPTPGPKPPQPPTPQPRKITAVVIEESSQRTPAQASVVLSPNIASWVQAGGHKWYVFDRDAENAGRVPVCDSRGCRTEQRAGVDASFKPFFDAARGKPLPRLVIAVQGQGQILSETALPATASETLALLKKFGGE